MFKKILLAILLLTILFVLYLAYVFKSRGDIVWLFSSEDMSIKVEEVASGLGIPWGMDFLDENSLIYTERSGNIGIVNLLSGQSQTIKQVGNLFHRGECGLLDVKASPAYETNHLVYFTYAKDIEGNGYTSLAVARVENDELSGWEDLFISKHDATDDWRHCGSRIAFDDRNHLYMSIGDRGYRPHAQDLSTHAGKIIRLTLEGTIPEGNPFILKDDSLAEIWSYGHRNPQGLAFDKANRRLWSNEHGPLGGDEINLINASRNYGWPLITHGREYASGASIGEGTEKEGVEMPFKVWSPSIAPSSLLYYQGQNLTGWQGNLFSTALVQKHINRLVLDSSGRVLYEERLLEELKERFRSIAVNDAGQIFVSTDNGRILKISLADDIAVSKSRIFKHIDMPGFYLSFEIKYLFSE
jgi:glucose/arabinose dehydrogenase